MITARDMILASQRTLYDALPRFGNPPSTVHASDVACQVRDTLETRRQDDNPHYVEHLDYRVSTCTVRQEVAKLCRMVKRGQGYSGNAYGYFSAENQAFARKLASSGRLPHFKARKG